jgi:hypothetical protein
MDTATAAPARPSRRAVRLAIAVAYSVGVSVIVGWSLREGAAASQRPAPPATPAVSERDAAAAKPSAATGKVRGAGDCSVCGVVESVRHIETYVEIMEGCFANESGGPSSRGYGLDDARQVGIQPLADIVATSVAGKRGGKRFAVSTRHQIVVRFRDGSRRILNETTPRALHEGERVIVIAGNGGTNG